MSPARCIPGPSAPGRRRPPRRGRKPSPSAARPGGEEAPAGLPLGIVLRGGDDLDLGIDAEAEGAVVAEAADGAARRMGPVGPAAVGVPRGRPGEGLPQARPIGGLPLDHLDRIGSLVENAGDVPGVEGEEVGRHGVPFFQPTAMERRPPASPALPSSRRGRPRRWRGSGARRARRRPAGLPPASPRRSGPRPRGE